MSAPLEYMEILGLLSDEELEAEYDWHRTRGKDRRRAGRYGLYWWHQKHCTLICDEIGRRAMLEEDVPGVYAQLTISTAEVFRFPDPDSR